MIRLESKKPLGRLSIRIITVASLAMIFVGMSAQNALALTYTSITRTLGPGARGTDVTNLQRFLASNTTIYPEGTISGYYGPLTRQAVVRFQALYGIPQVGQVGPMTLQKINSLIANDQGIDVTAPWIRSVTASTSSSSATLTWVTDEMATAKIYYSTAPLQMTEAETQFSAPIVSGGTVYVPDSVSRTSHSFTLSNLTPNTPYNYLIQVTDASGNVSVYSNMFRTN